MRICVFHGNTGRSDQSFFSNPGSALLIYSNISTKYPFAEIYIACIFNCTEMEVGNTSSRGQEKHLWLFFFGMCGKGLTAGDGTGGVPCVCAAQRYGPLGLWFVHTCRRILHNDVGVLGTRGVHIGVRRMV